MESSPSLSERELADLVALADGSLAPAKRAQLEARVAVSPALRAALEEQRRAVQIVREAAGPAPPALREHLDAERRRSAPRARRRRFALACGAAGALAAAIAALVLTLPGGTPGAPTVVQAAHLAARPPSGPAPQRSDGSGLLVAAVDGVSYPYWGDRFAWETSGMRQDRLDGRRATTVYYQRAGRRIGYTIVAGPSLKWPARASVQTRGGTTLRSFTTDGRTIVTWRRGGHTCVLSGVGVAPGELLDLAAWQGAGAAS